jgi:hypothetical protein
MRVMNLPLAVSIPSDLDEAVGVYRARLGSGRRVPSELSQLLLAYMAWPNEEESRDRWMVSGNTRRLAFRDGLSSPPPISLFGGPEAVAGEALNGVAGRLVAETNKWPPVADVMQMLVDLHYSGLPLPGGASVSKAMVLCADDQSGLSEGQMRRQWSRFRDVAHLLAAGALLAMEVPENGSIFSAAWYAPDSLLGISAGFESFGLAFTPRGQPDPVLPPNSTWRLPRHCIPDKPWLRHRTLSERQREVLAVYAARKSYIRKS